MSENHEGSLSYFKNEREEFKKEMDRQRNIQEQLKEGRNYRVYNCASAPVSHQSQSCAQYNPNSESLIEEINRLRVENANLKNENYDLYAKIKRLRTHNESLILNNTQAHQSGFISVSKKEESYVMRDMFVANWKQRITSAKEFVKNLADKTIKWFNT